MVKLCRRAAFRIALHNRYLARVIRTGTLNQAQANRRHLRLANGTGYWRSDLIEPGSEAGSASQPWQPQAFLVEQDPDSEILPHYHEEDEFQVVVEGGGSFGRHPVRPVTVHFAGSHTGYGPIRSGDRGLWYFSLRPRRDPGARFLPEWRDRMKKGPRRHILADPVSAGVAGTRTVIEPQPDGLAAWVVCAPPQARIEPPAPRPGAARYYVVIDGSIDWQGSRLPGLSTAFAAGESFQPLAGPAGASLLALQFPC